MAVSPDSMNLTGTVYLSKRAAQFYWFMRRFSRPVWRHINTKNCRGQQEGTI
jgi:hypothetical protein